MLQHSGVIIIGDDIREYIIPEIAFQSLAALDFLDLTKKIRNANPGAQFSYSMMQDIWADIARNVYYFEHPMRVTKKTKDVCKSKQ